MSNPSNFFAHMINPVDVPESSDLFTAQPVTFESIRIAKNFAKDQVNIDLFTAQYPEDHPIIPNWFTKTPDLTRSVLDLRRFERKRKLPILKDILDRLVNASDAKWLIYTNVDIILQPYFYLTINSIIEQGYDAFVINRRTISDQYSQTQDIPLMYAQTGNDHPGHDCFIFHRDAYEKYELGTVCIGAVWIGRVLIANMTSYANQFKEFTDLHLTFHIGNDQVWRSDKYLDYSQHNENQFIAVRSVLEENCGPFEKSSLVYDYLYSNIPQHLKPNSTGSSLQQSSSNPLTKIMTHVKKLGFFAILLLALVS